MENYCHLSGAIAANADMTTSSVSVYSVSSARGRDHNKAC